MDWENKISSILKETEANLARVKNKFVPGSASWSQKNNSMPVKKSSSLMDLPMSSTPKFLQNGGYSRGHHDTYGAVESIGHFNGTSSGIVPYPTTQALQERIEQQSIAIDHLTGLIHRLETDRNNYQEQIRDLRNEIYTLTEKSGTRRSDPQVERRVEQVRRELLGEIQLLQSQLQLSSAKGNSSQLSDAQLLAMNRDVLEIKHAFRDELESYKRDIEILRSRIVKVELELASVLSGKREVERRQDKFDRTLNTMSLAQMRGPHPQLMEFTNTTRHLEKMQIDELREHSIESGDLRQVWNTLGALKDKIDIMESTIVKTPVMSPKKPGLPMNGYTSLENGSSSQNAILEDLGLSEDDSESSDFTEFEPENQLKKKRTLKKKKDVDLDTVDTDDLDIDDLDLSDDDLSQTSLMSEPIDDADLT